MSSNLNYLGMAANQTLRWIAAGLLLIAAGLAIALPFISATVLTLAIGGVAISAGIAQILRIGNAADGRSKLFRALAGMFYGVSGFWILLNPVASEVSLTLFAGLLLLAFGLLRRIGVEDRIEGLLPRRRVLCERQGTSGEQQHPDHPGHQTLQDAS